MLNLPWKLIAWMVLYTLLQQSHENQESALIITCNFDHSSASLMCDLHDAWPSRCLQMGLLPDT